MATSQALAAYRGARAVELAVTGVPYAEITRELGYRSTGSVSKAMWKTIDRRAAAGVEAYRARELRRLDALERAHWSDALEGSTTAAEVVLSVIEKRIRLLGPDRADDAPPRPAGVVDTGFWHHVREAHDGKMSGYLEDHRDGGCGSRKTR